MQSTKYSGSYGAYAYDERAIERIREVDEKIEETAQNATTREERDKLTKLYFEKMIRGILLTQCVDSAFL